MMYDYEPVLEYNETTWKFYFRYVTTRNKELPF